ncbi:hypothetical protein G7076_01120 [Sphingomonas sp. HDW15A]|nr:hypothetical protein G7076_01120 [Sphingomonas sp. HDW15A]
MARYDGELIAAGEIAFDLGDLARTLAGSTDEAERARRLAMARLLSATEGWKAAAAALDGAFAEALGESGLTTRKDR